MTITADSAGGATNGIHAASLENGVTVAQKPHLVVACTPADGHTGPVLNVIAELAKRGYGVTFIGGEAYRSKIAAMGPAAELVPIKTLEDTASFAEREALPPGMPRLMWGLKHFFIGQTGWRWEVVKETLVRVHQENPKRPIVLVTEIGFVGCSPLVWGAALPEGLPYRPKVVQLGVSCYMGASIDTAPFGTALPPDSTESGRLRNKLLEQMFCAGPFAEALAYQAEVMKELGAVDYTAHPTPFSAWFTCDDATLQLCPPSLEYVLSDHSPKVKFVGAVPPKPLPEDFQYPSWWSDVINKGDKKVVTLTQGTVAMEFAHLIIPALRGLADRDDLIVVTILGKEGAVLPDDVAIPANTRLIDHLPYDAVLPYTDVFVMNAGYGGMIHGMINGVPMVLAGATQDKPEVSMRAEYAGIAVNLKTGTPTPEQVREGVDKVLADPKYKKRVLEIREENEALKVIDRVEQQVMQFAKETEKDLRAFV